MHWQQVLEIFTTVIVLLMFLGPPIGLVLLYLYDKNQTQHSVLRNFPILGRIRYFLEMIGPELRQYMFDADHDGKPFSRSDFQNIVLSGKYLKTLISFGSKRDFAQPGWYVRNSMFPMQVEDMRVDDESELPTRRYEIAEEGLFTRKEIIADVKVKPWTLPESDAIVIGPGCRHPWKLRGVVGMSAMSYGSLGSHAISAMSHGLGMATGSWVHTGEGGLAPYHLLGGGDVIMQFGSGIFGARDKNGDWSWEKFEALAANPQLKMFEIKLAQGAKIRGGHVEGKKITPEIAAIRGVEPWKSVDSPNRHRQFHDIPSMIDFIEDMRRRGGKPVGVKIVMGSPDSADDLARFMARTGRGPDAITVDGGEGGSGATYQEMADSMGLPVFSGLIYLDNALRKYGVRNRVKVFASGKLFSPDLVAIAMGMGADCVNIARGLMISVGCIGAQKCHTNKCPVGVATTDPEAMKGLVIDEKKWRVMNYIITLRNGLNSLAAAAGLESYSRFTRKHVVYKDEHGKATSLEDLFPYPELVDVV